MDDIGESQEVSEEHLVNESEENHRRKPKRGRARARGSGWGKLKPVIEAEAGEVTERKDDDNNRATQIRTPVKSKKIKWSVSRNKWIQVDVTSEESEQQENSDVDHLQGATLGWRIQEREWELREEALRRDGEDSNEEMKEGELRSPSQVPAPTNTLMSDHQRHAILKDKIETDEEEKSERRLVNEPTWSQEDSIPSNRTFMRRIESQEAMDGSRFHSNPWEQMYI